MSMTDELLKEALVALKAHGKNHKLIRRIQKQLETTASIVWSIEDVKTFRESLTDKKARKVLDETIRYHDCSSGITWDSFEYTLDNLYPLQ